MFRVLVIVHMNYLAVMIRVGGIVNIRTYMYGVTTYIDVHDYGVKTCRDMKQFG